MPESGQEPDDRQVEHESPLRHTATAQREIHIVAKPRTERHVPATPEFGDGLREVGIVEVLEELESEHASEANRHVGVAAEVEVDLQRVADGPEPRERAGWRGRSERLVRHFRHHVGEQHLLVEADDEPEDATRELVPAGPARSDLVTDRCVAHNGARNELREERNVQGQQKRIALGPDATGDVDHVAERLEGEERDTNRQQEARLGNRALPGREPVAQRRRDEIRVFPNADQGEIARHRTGEHHLRVRSTRT